MSLYKLAHVKYTCYILVICPWLALIPAINVFQTKKKDMLCNFLVYVKVCMEQLGSGIKEAEIVHLLKNSVVLVTNKGPKQPSKEIIHFSSSFLPDPDLQTLFPGITII